MIGSIKPVRAFSGEDKLEELRRMKTYFKDKFNERYSSYDEKMKKRLGGVESTAEGRAYARFRQKYLEKNMYMCVEEVW